MSHLDILSLFSPESERATHFGVTRFLAHGEIVRRAKHRMYFLVKGNKSHPGVGV